MSIETKAARGVAWNVLTSVFTRVFQLVGTLILTRFIAPDHYGEVSAAVVVVQTAAQLTTFSFGQYLIAYRSPPRVCFQAALLHFLLGILGMGAVIALRDPLSSLVDVPGMVRYVPGLALAQMIDRSRLIPERMLVRDLKFRAVALVNSVGEATFTITALATAKSLGGGAIVAGGIARSVITAIIFIWLAPRREWFVFSKLEMPVVKGLLGYGVWIMLAALSSRAASTWDNLLMAGLFGPSVMGRYNLAYNLAETPLTYVADRISDVLMPSFSKMEPEERKAAVVRAAGIMSIAVAPLGVGLGAVAPTVVRAFFDARWLEMAPMLTILSVMTVFLPAPWSASAYLQAEKKTRLITISNVFHAIVLLSSVYVFGKLGGPLWACIAVGVAAALQAIVTILATGRVTPLSSRAYLVAVARPLLACVPMFLAVSGVRALLDDRAPLGLSLAVQVVVGGVVYIVGLLVVARQGTMELITIARGARGRKGRDSAPPSSQLSVPPPSSTKDSG